MVQAGRLGEACVAEVLRRRGWNILLYNWRDRFSEIDLVALAPDGALHLIEVKTRHFRSKSQFAHIESISRKQLVRLRRALPRLLQELSGTASWHSFHLDAAFVFLGPHNARISYFPDCHG